MAIITDYLKQILSARYGKDVRQAIHDSIEEINGIATGAQSSATTAANTATAKASEAVTASNTATQKAEEALASAEQAKIYADNAGTNIVQTTDTTLSGSYAGGLKINSISGASEQYQGTITDESGNEITVPNPDYPQEINSVTGKNLLDCRGLTETTTNGITFTPVYDANGNLEYIEANGTASALTGYNISTKNYFEENEYIFSGCPSGGSTSRYYMQYKYTNNDTGSGTTLTLSESVSNVNIRIVIVSGQTVSGLKFYPMIRKASITDDTYVPYGCMRIWAHGRNLGKITLLGTITKNGVTYTNNGDGSVTIKGTATAYTLFDLCKVFDKVKLGETYRSKDATMRVVYNDGTATRYLDTVTITDNVKNIILQRSIAADDSIDATYYPMVCHKDYYDGTYEPYQSKSITLSQPITLHGIGDVRDRIVQKDGVWQIERKFAEVVLDGSSDWRWNQNFAVSYDITNTARKVTSNNETTNSICSHFKTVARSVLFSDYESFAINVNGVICMYSTKFPTLDDTIAYVTENPITVIYELATPIYEELPAVDQIALNSLKPFDGVTYLYCDSEIQPAWDVEYGTSKVGGYTLEARNTAECNRLQIADLTSAVLALNQE